MIPLNAWEPQRSPDAVEQWIAASTREGVTTFRNTSSAFWAVVAIVGQYLMCMALLGPSILEDVDPMGGREVAATGGSCFLLSLAAYLILVRTRVLVSGLELKVLNPLFTHVFSLESGLRLTQGRFGFPALKAHQRSVYLLGMEMVGGDVSSDYIALERMIESAPSSSGGVVKYRKGLRPPDVGLSLLLVAWVVYAARFLM